MGMQGSTGPTGPTGPAGSSASLAYLSTRALAPGSSVDPNAPFSFDPLPPSTYGTSNITIDPLGQTITVLEDGDYDISYFVSAFIDGANTNETILTINGNLELSSYSAQKVRFGTGFDGIWGETIVTLAANDQIQLINIGSQAIVTAGSVTTYLIINKVS
jgi:hypothetical protein